MSGAEGRRRGGDAAALLLLGAGGAAAAGAGAGAGQPARRQRQVARAAAGGRRGRRGGSLPASPRAAVKYLGGGGEAGPAPRAAAGSERGRAGRSPRGAGGEAAKQKVRGVGRLRVSRFPITRWPLLFRACPWAAGGRTGTLEAAERSGRCRSRSGWQPPLGASREGWGLPLPGKRSGRAKRRETGEGDGNCQVFWGAVTSGPPEHPQSALCFPLYPPPVGSAGCRRVTGTRCSAAPALPRSPRPQAANAARSKRRWAPRPHRVFFPLVVFFSLDVAFLQVWADFLAPSLKNLVLRTLPQLILCYLKAVLVFLVLYEALPFVLLVCERENGKLQCLFVFFKKITA